MGVHMAFGKRVMGPALHGLARGFVIARRGEDDDQGIRRGLDHLIERLDALAVGQREVKQNPPNASRSSRSRASDSRVTHSTRNV